MLDRQIKNAYSNDMKNLNQIKIEFEKIKTLPDSTVLANIQTLSGHEKFNNLADFLYYLETQVFDNEDRVIYGVLLGRKPVSYSFNPSAIQRSRAALAIFSVIRP